MLNLEMSKYSIVKLEKVHSTNSYALENIDILNDKTVVFAFHQTEGRGRFNRKWVYDDTENLYMSLILKPENTSSYPYQNLTQYLSVVVCKILEKDFGMSPEIKWPNDILVDGAKISGILAETHALNNKIQAVVLGLGLNVNLKEETIKNIDQKATSLSVIKNCIIDTTKILNSVCDMFFDEYDDFIKEGFCYIKDEYIKRCAFLGKTISIREEGEKKQFYAKSIDDNGLLIVKDELGRENKIITGDILC